MDRHVLLPMTPCGQARFITHADRHQARSITHVWAWCITHATCQKSLLRQSLVNPVTRARVFNFPYLTLNAFNAVHKRLCNPWKLKRPYGPKTGCRRSPSGPVWSAQGASRTFSPPKGDAKGATRPRPPQSLRPPRRARTSSRGTCRPPCPSPAPCGRLRRELDPPWGAAPPGSLARSGSPC